jgi:hypothetical protein
MPRLFAMSRLHAEIVNRVTYPRRDCSPCHRSTPRSLAMSQIHAEIVSHVTPTRRDCLPCHRSTCRDHLLLSGCCRAYMPRLLPSSQIHTDPLFLMHTRFTSICSIHTDPPIHMHTCRDCCPSQATLLAISQIHTEIVAHVTNPCRDRCPCHSSLSYGRAVDWVLSASWCWQAGPLPQ